MPAIVGGTLNQLLRAQSGAGHGVGGQVPAGNMMPCTRIFRISREKTAQSKVFYVTFNHCKAVCGHVEVSILNSSGMNAAG